MLLSNCTWAEQLEIFNRLGDQRCPACGQNHSRSGQMRMFALRDPRKLSVEDSAAAMAQALALRLPQVTTRAIYDLLMPEARPIHTIMARLMELHENGRISLDDFVAIGRVIPVMPEEEPEVVVVRIFSPRVGIPAAS